MKKIFSIMLVAALALPMFAEEANYSDWLPKAGDWNVQVGMNPMGIVMGGSWTGIGGFSAGYMVTDHMSVKATLGLDVSIWNNRGYAIDDKLTAENHLNLQEVVDTRKDTKVGGSLSLGAEWHVGDKHKVQGVFGAGLIYGVKAIDKHQYYYGNAITEYNQKPTISDAVDIKANPIFPGYVSLMSSGMPDARVLSEYVVGGRHMVGAYGTFGAEWFVTPKLALGLNLSVNLAYEFMHAYVKEYEGWNTITHERVELWKDSDRPMENGFSFSTGNVGTNFYVSIYL